MLRAINRWIRHRQGRVLVSEIDPSWDLEWHIKWPGADEYFTFQGTSPGIATVMLQMKQEFDDLPEELLVTLPDGKVARIR
jgi:hypothetical protein